MRRPMRVPLWADQLLKEMMKPPYFLQPPQKPTIPAAEKETPPPQRHTDNKMSNNKIEVHKKTTNHPAPENQKPKQKISVTRAKPRSSTGNKVVPASETKTMPPIPNQSVLADLSIPNDVLSHYNWKIQHIEAISNVAKITTQTGKFALKQTHITPPRVAFLHQIQEYAKEHHFDHFAPMLLTKEQSPAIQMNHKTYYVTHWIDGQTTNFASIEHVGQVAYALAQFHASTKGCKVSEQVTPVFDLLQITEQRHRDLRQMLRTVEAKRDRDTFDDSFLSVKSDVLTDAQQSMDILSDGDCTAFLKQDQNSPGLCHLDVIPGNFIYTPHRHVVMIDLDLASFAPRVLDLAHLLRRSLQQTNWDSEYAYTCFLHYNVVQTMPKVEYLLVQALLRFPYRIWRLAHTRYRFFADTGQIEDLQGYLEQERRRQKFLSEFTHQVETLGTPQN